MHAASETARRMSSRAFRVWWGMHGAYSATRGMAVRTLRVCCRTHAASVAPSQAPCCRARRSYGAIPCRGVHAIECCHFGRPPSLFNAVESTPSNAARFAVFAPLFDAVESTPWNGAKFAVFAPLFDAVESTPSNAARPDVARGAIPPHQRLPGVVEKPRGVQSHRHDSAFTWLIYLHLGMRVRTDAYT